MIAAMVGVAATGLAVVLTGCLVPVSAGHGGADRDGAPLGSAADRPRVLLWGDSLAWESQEVFVRAARAEGADARVRTFGGTALCDWLTDIDRQTREWAPTTAVLAFSGNAATPCMRGRDLMAAYRADATTAASRLAAAGTHVVFAVAPPRRDQPVSADGATELEHVWRQVVASVGAGSVTRAGLAVTAAGRWTDRLPCRAGELCRPDGTVVVRGPDGVHFCPIALPAATACPVFAAGAVRYGTSLAAAALGGGELAITGAGQASRRANRIPAAPSGMASQTTMTSTAVATPSCDDASGGCANDRLSLAGPGV